MSESKFTQGAWWAIEGLAEDTWDIRTGGGDDAIAICETVWEEADAHLIAAAPLLYKALRQLERAFAVGAEGYRAVADREGALRAARAALRAARGEEA